MTRISLFFLAAALFAAACSSEGASDLMDKARGLEKADNPEEALPLYEKLYQEHADDDNAPEALFRCAAIYYNTQKDILKAATTYELVSEKYPDSEYGHKGLFIAAFTYANELANYERARTAYEKYLSAYPDSSMTETVRFELENLGKTPEELLESLQQPTAEEAPVTD
ncbi:MAG: hypothetical protein C0600_03200 [Ignavibacteria bacterium]|nr:MAG: hypothetical protein C0600_03200 [Ignavibacteria bacterium]